MDDNRNDRIIYDEGWQKVSIPQVVEPVKEKENENTKQPQESKKEKKKHSFPALISIQLVACIMIAVTIFALKFMDSEVFTKISDWFYEMSEITLVPNSTFENFDLSKYLESTADVNSATNDEI